MRILTGIQPSGAPHLGNYFGAMRPAIELQERGDAYYFIADYHAQTSMTDPSLLKERVYGIALDFLACGLDPEKTVFFRQSAVPEVHEMAWYLSTVTPVGLLERCHSYKDKVARGIAPNHGLFAYPVLMAADIVLYDSNVVPVGKDQKQHLEVTRDLVGKFNERYGDVLVMPEVEIRDEVALLPGVDGEKMSKSYGNTVEIFEEEKGFRKKIMKIKTDSTPVEDPKPVEGSLLIEFARCVATEEVLEGMKQSMQAGGKGYGEYKKQVFELLWDYFAPYREKRSELAKDPSAVWNVLELGGLKARETASGVLKRVREAVGMKM